MSGEISTSSLSISFDVELNEMFQSKKDVVQKVSMIAIRKNFEFKVQRSNKEVLYLKCKDVNCQWRMRAIRVRHTDLFRVSRYQQTHSCCLVLR